MIHLYDTRKFLKKDYWLWSPSWN